ncbi:MFS transporter [Hymenobacter rubidus]|uniref:MFS transporter n=1 Tax=Hymenobacter rubidus TaxID=1441626 RepID=UPI00191FA8AF|nr:MFS transporter [Hymenobacter rubidus]
MPTNLGRYRWVVVALLFFATTINYLDRQVIGLLKPVLEQDFAWTETDYSHIVVVFSTAYALGLLLFGRLISQLGTKRGYTVALVVWSVAAMAHAAVNSTFGFGAVRALLGLGEAGNFPAAITAVAEWFPKKERALATGIFNSGANIGAVVAPVMVPWILGAYGWKEAFVITGSIGFVWLIFWLVFYEIPSRQKRLSAPELAYVNSDNEPEQAPGEAFSWGELLRFRQTWVFIVGKFLTDPIWWFFLFWLPSYFATTFNLDLKKPSLPLVIVYTATTVGSIGGGYLSSALIKHGWPVARARKTAMLLFALLVVPVIMARYATSIWPAVALISLAAAAHQAWSANIFTIASDMFPKQSVPSVIGIGGMAGSIGSLLFPLLVGYLLDLYKSHNNLLGGYNLLFSLCGFSYLLAWGLMHLLAPTMQPVQIRPEPTRVLA